MSEPRGDGDIDFPELRQSTLGDETLARYFGDLERVADVREVRVKAASRSHAEDETVGLDRARDLLSSGDVRGIQIRYLWRDEAWWDTLIRTGGGVQITRVQPPEFEDLH